MADGEHVEGGVNSPVAVVGGIVVVRALVRAFVLVVTAAGPAAAQSGPQCGDTITESVTLTRNLVCRGTALTVPGFGPRAEYGQRIRIGLAGHTIKGDGTGVGIAMYRGFRYGPAGVDLVNGTITGFASALISTARITAGPGSLSITRMKLVRNTKWVSLGSNDDITVLDSEFIDTGTGGPGSDSDMIINHSTFVRSPLITAYEGNMFVYNSRFTGTSFDARWLVAVGNTITACEPATVAGITVFDGSARIQGNTVSRCGTGIRLGPLERPVSIEGNTLSRNAGEGLVYRTGTFSQESVSIVGNVFTRNGGDGLAGSGDRPVTLTGNTATKNAGHGMNLSGSQIATGGGNTAFRNGVDPQCLGLVCGQWSSAPMPVPTPVAGRS